MGYFLLFPFTEVVQITLPSKWLCLGLHTCRVTSYLILVDWEVRLTTLLKLEKNLQKMKSIIEEYLCDQCGTLAVCCTYIVLGML